jgi:DNA polymerase-3 subunit beta
VGDFLPQLEAPPKAQLGRFFWGLLLMTLGLFEKVVLADTLLSGSADKLTFAAADSFRLAVRGAQLQASGGGVATAVNDILIPAKTLTELARILPDEGSVRITPTLNRNQVLFQTDGLDLVSTLIAGQFPNYEAVLPKDNTKSIALHADDLAGAISRVAQFADERSRAVRLKLEKGELKLSASSTETGESEDTIETDYNGEPLTIGLKWPIRERLIARLSNGGGNR